MDSGDDGRGGPSPGDYVHFPNNNNNNNNNSHNNSRSRNPNNHQQSTNTAGGCSLREQGDEGNSGGRKRSAENPIDCPSSSGWCPLDDPGLALWTWGRGEDGQLGVGEVVDEDEPVYVDSLRDVCVRDVACGSGHTVVLDGEGVVYTWGRGDDGRLGHSDNAWKYVPRPVLSLRGSAMIVEITCGSYHTAAVSSTGELYTWGGGMYGKLGHNSENGLYRPKRVDVLLGIPIRSVACGSRHTIAVTKNTGTVYSWGDKENGVAGHGDREGHQYTPKIIESIGNEYVTDISACGFHSGCITRDGRLFTWGEGKFGRLGHGNEKHCYSPKLVEFLIGKSPKHIACGGFHSAVLSQNGAIYTFGGGEHGQLGQGDRINKLRPTMVVALEGVHISQISCGWSHSVALCSETNKVYTWGNGDHGKLGLGNMKKISIPQVVDKLQDYKVFKIASYNEHTAVLVEPYDLRGNFVASVGYSLSSVSNSYLREMRNLVNNEEFSDVTFIVEDRPIYAHRAILAQRCDHFAAMFRSGMRESTEREVRIQGASYTTFLLVLKYLYTDSLKVDPEYAIEMYMIADLYRLDRLKDMCSRVAKRSLTCENAAVMLEEASNANCLAVKDVCMDFIVKNFDIVSKSEGIREVSHSLLLEILAMRSI